MNVLIDLEKCREYMTIHVGGKLHKIKLSGTIEDPYFCGNDICNVLGYDKSSKALRRHVDEEDKKILTMVNINHVLGKKEISYREGQIVFVSESGLYSLILASQAPFAKEFKKTVCKKILPSIRKYGSYQIELRLAQAIDQLSIKDVQLEQESELREQESEARKAAEERAIKAERKALRVNKFMKRVTIKEKKMEWIYIATNKFYAMERLFKIGSTIRLSSRIGGYNTGRVKGVDNYYYVWAIKCYNSKDLDSHIQKLLVDFKWNPKLEQSNKENRSEMYHGIKFVDLRDIVNFIVNNFDASVDYINNFIKNRLDVSMEEEDEVPAPLDYKRLTYQIGEHIETIDLEEEESESVREAFEDILATLKEQHERDDEEPIVMQRKELMSRLSKVTNTTKKDLWGQIKEFTGWKDSKTNINEGSFEYKITY